MQPSIPRSPRILLSGAPSRSCYTQTGLLRSVCASTRQSPTVASTRDASYLRRHPPNGAPTRPVTHFPSHIRRNLPAHLVYSSAYQVRSAFPLLLRFLQVQAFCLAQTLGSQLLKAATHFLRVAPKPLHAYGDSSHGGDGVWWSSTTIPLVIISQDHPLGIYAHPSAPSSRSL